MAETQENEMTGSTAEQPATGETWRSARERWPKRVVSVGPKRVVWVWIGNPFEAGLPKHYTDTDQFVQTHHRGRLP